MRGYGSEKNKPGVERVSPEEVRAARRRLPVLLGSFFTVMLALYQSVLVFLKLGTELNLLHPGPISFLEVAIFLVAISFLCLIFATINDVIFSILLCFYLTRAEYEELNSPNIHIPLVTSFLDKVHHSILDWREKTK
jgi:hypothetical protein